jgi:metal-responsive CopG/Arc/MetJ family transcriptional regulator
MKTAISIPDNLFKDAEEMARRLGLSRSELYQRALARFLEQNSGDVIREALDRVYSQEGNRNLDALVRIAGEQILSEKDW